MPGSARGSNHDAYRLEPRPVGTGGQADVFRATVKESGAVVAFKRVKGLDEDSLARLKREAEVGTTIAHRNVMPVIDANTDAGWVVMPLAEYSLETARARLQDATSLAALVDDICAGLDAAHALDWIHRDVKPSNILWLNDGQGGRWVVADWGLVRRPRGATTLAGRTALGTSFGTAGFAAPELSGDPHSVTASADVFSLGQVIGWIVTGREPQPNIPLLPDGPLRSVVRAATSIDPARRIASVEALAGRVRDASWEPPPNLAEEAQQLVDACEAPRTDPQTREAVERMARFAEEHDGDQEIYIDHLSRLDAEAVNALVTLDPDRAGRLLATMRDHLLDDDWGRRDFNWANVPILWFLDVAKAAAQNEVWDLFEDAVQALFDADVSWDRFRARDAIAGWLLTVTGEAGRLVAIQLRNNPEAAGHYADMAGRVNDPYVRGALEAV